MNNNLNHSLRKGAPPSTRSMIPELALIGPARPWSEVSLVDRLIDSPVEWRTLICEANQLELESVSGDSLQARLGECEIKRQELIHELIQTERHHCLTLALMKQIYLNGLTKLAEQRASRQDNNSSGMAQLDLERLFPALDELIEAHELLFAHLRLRLVECCQSKAEAGGQEPPLGCVGPIGDLLLEQFRVSAAGGRAGGDQTATGAPAKCNGRKLLQAYARFCGHQNEANRYYKQLMQADKQFRQFMENCNKQHPACRQRGFLDCNLLVTQRLTKYPLLIEQLIKFSKGAPDDEEEKLSLALAECRSLLAKLNAQLARKESFEQLLEIYAQFSPKSFTIYYDHQQHQHQHQAKRALDWRHTQSKAGAANELRFTKHNLLQQHKRLRQLRHCDHQLRMWSATRRKLFPVVGLILNDIIVFLTIDSVGHLSSSQRHLVAIEDTSNQAAAAVAAAANERELDEAANKLSASSSLNDIEHQRPPPPPPPAAAPKQPQEAASSLISAVANALHSAGVYHGHSRPAALLSGSSLALNQQQQQQQCGQKLEPADCKGQLQPTTSSKYQFANIDSKSSVISLSKLLIREKAVEEAEPRVYLISSSPSQPEMYELAFSSRRHQATFLAKLRASIDEHQQAQEQQQQPTQQQHHHHFHHHHHRRHHRQQLSELMACDCEFAACRRSSRANRRFRRRSNTSAGSLCYCSISEQAAELSNSSSSSVFSMSMSESDAEDNSSGRASNCDQVGESTDGQATDSKKVDCVSVQEAEMSSNKQPDGNKSDGQKTDDEEEQSGEHKTNLIERARDSCDEQMSPIKTHKSAPLRRRRAQRPRQVSNQSTSSAISSSSSSSSASMPAASSTRQQLAFHDQDEEFDSGRGQDECSLATSSSSSSTSGGSVHSMSKMHAAKRPLEVSGHSEPQDELLIDSRVTSDNSSIPSPSSSSSSSASSSISSCTLDCSPNSATAPNAAADEDEQQNEAELSDKEAACKQRRSIKSTGPVAVRQQRKLSTVSTMTCQLKSMRQLRKSVECRVCASRSPRDSGAQFDSFDGAASLFVRASQQQQQQQQQSAAGSMSRRSRSSTLSSFQPEQKLEELRNLRIQLDKDKAEWQEKFDRMQEQLLNERHELDLAREKLRHERQQVADEREQLYRKLDSLKQNGILLSPSNKVIITSPDARLHGVYGGPQQQQQHPSYQPPASVGCMRNSYAAAHPHGDLRQPSSNQPANPKMIPLHLSQQINQTRQQHHHYQQLRVPFISSIPGATYIAERFGAVMSHQSAVSVNQNQTTLRVVDSSSDQPAQLGAINIVNTRACGSSVVL